MEAGGTRRNLYSAMEKMAAPERTERFAMPTPIARRSLGVEVRNGARPSRSDGLAQRPRPRGFLALLSRRPA